MHSSRLGVFLHDIDAQVVIEAARGLYGNGDEESVRMLSELAGKPNVSNSVRRYAVAASFRRGGLPEAEMVLTIAADPKVSADVRVEAMDALMAWEEPSNIDRLSGQYRPVQKREELDLTQFLSGQLVGIFTGPAEVTIKAAELVAFFHVEVAVDLLTIKST